MSDEITLYTEKPTISWKQPKASNSATSTWANYWGSNSFNYYEKQAYDVDTSTMYYDAETDKNKWSWDSGSRIGTDITNSSLSGAATGASIGLAFGGIGALIGGAIGAIGGFFDALFGSGQSERTQEQKEYDSYLEQITTAKENLTTQYNREMEDLERQRDITVQQLNTENTRLQMKTDSTVESRNSQLELTEKQIYAQSLEYNETLRNANRELIKETSKQTAKLGSSGFRNTGTATARIEETQREGEREITNQKYQMDMSLYSSNYSMGQNYINSTYNAYSYQENIVDNITNFNNWLTELEAEIRRTKEDYDSAMEDYNQSLKELRESKDYDAALSIFENLTNGLKTFGSSLSSSIAKGNNIFNSNSNKNKDYYDIVIENA